MSFNPRAHVGRDCQLRKRAHVPSVSIHAPTWGATSPRPLLSSMLRFQSTRPRGARLCCLDASRQRGVSIHAPTWGATTMEEAVAYCERVSIHAPTWGATLEEWLCEEYGVFQSTRPRGARLEIEFKDRHIPYVSIHAPTWGATLRCQNKSVD